jgi:hypothetical protein
VLESDDWRDLRRMAHGANVRVGVERFGQGKQQGMRGPYQPRKAKLVVAKVDRLDFVVIEAAVRREVLRNWQVVERCRREFWGSAGGSRRRPVSAERNVHGL